MIEMPDALIIYASSPLVMKVLGPTADYLGEGIKNFAQKRIDNLTKIFQKAEKKQMTYGILDGEVPARVLRHIIDEASYVENELTAEYFSGVFATSKSAQIRDDRSLTLLKTLSGMSNYEIRMHYILYRTY